MNRVTLTATTLEVKPVRYTPAGVPVLEILLQHQSQVTEAGTQRLIDMTLPGIALGDIAIMLSDTPLGASLTINGFLAPAKKGASKLVLHFQTVTRNTVGNDPVTV